MSEILEMIAGAIFYIIGMIVVTALFLVFVFGIFVAPMPYNLIFLAVVVMVVGYFIE